MLTEKEKKEMYEDAQSKARRRDFKILSDVKPEYFTLAFLKQITGNIAVKYPRHIIRADKNRL